MSYLDGDYSSDFNSPFDMDPTEQDLLEIENDTALDSERLLADLDDEYDFSDPWEKDGTPYLYDDEDYDDEGYLVTI